MGSYFCAIFDKEALDKAINDRWISVYLNENKVDFIAFLQRLNVCEFKNHLVYTFESFRDTGFECRICNEALTIASKIENESEKIIIQNTYQGG